MEGLTKSVAKYGPVVGAGSYALLSVNVLNPSLHFGLELLLHHFYWLWLNLSCFSRIISKGDATNALLAGSLLGASAYIYNRPHLQSTTQRNRLIYAGFGSLTFTFSSILLWAILRNLLPNNAAIASVAGLGSGYLWATTAQGYFELVDAQVPKK